MKNTPNTRVIYPSPPKILYNLAHFLPDFLRFPTTAVHSSSEAVRTHPRYLKDDNEVSERLYAWKCRSVLSRISSATILRRFRSAPLMHWAVLGWRPFKSAHGTSIAQRGQHMWGGFPFPRMITVSRTCRCKKGTCIPVLISGLPLHPSICHPLSPSASGKEIRYVCVYPAGGVATTNLPSQHYQFRSKLQSLHLYPMA